MRCGGSISASGRRSVPFVVPGTYRIFGPHYAWKPRSRPDRVHPEIIARNDSGLPFSAPLAVGPSIILTGLYSGATLTSASGQNYVTPVPLPGMVWSFSPEAVGRTQGGCIAEMGWKPLRRESLDQRGCFLCSNR